MNKAEKAVVQYELEREKAVLRELERHYEYALKGINERLKVLQSTPETQSKVYQKQYQETLKKQVSAILERLHSDTYSSLDQYRHDAYTTGFVGTMYDLHSQDVPLLIPIDQEAVLKAVQHDTVLTSPLYDELGIDTKKMSRSISKELSRGLASGLTYDDIARNIKNATKAPLARAKLIARTEGHRIQQASAQDAREAAKENGAEVVKQWDATMDGDTRPNHRMLDGQIREVEEPFEVGSYTPMHPGDFGEASEDCNCRCQALTRATWALDEDELKVLRERAVRHSLYADDPKAFRAAKLPALKSFPEFQKSYLKAAEEEAKIPKFVPAKSIEEAEKFARQHGVKYADFSKLPLTTANELNQALLTLPDDAKPVFVGASSTLEQYWGGKLPRSSKQYYGVTVDTYSGIHLGQGKGYDFDTNGYMVGISSSYKTSDKITAAKKAAQERYQKQHGRKWFFNETGETTAMHEMGHVYANIRGLPDGFENDALRWAAESGCDMLKKPSEAWAEAWAAYHTKANELPDYISKYIEAASGRRSSTKGPKSLIFFDDDGIISKKKADFKQAFEAGKIRTIISPQKQARHIKSSKQFAEYSAKLAARGDYPSYIREDLSNNDLKNLVVSKLKGNVQVTDGRGYREFVICDEVIGYYYSKAHGKYIATRCAQINYATGDGNIHIIPVKELPEGGGVRESQD